MRRINKNAKATVILVHGGFEHFSRYRWFMGVLVKNGYNIISGDLPGHGVNTKSRGDITSFEEYLKTVDHWYEEAAALSLPIILIGHSMGGLIIVRYLQTRVTNIHSVLLSSPCFGLQEPPEKITYALARMFYRVYPKFRVPVPILFEKMTSNREVQIDIKNDPLFVKEVSIRWFIELEKAIKAAFDDIERTNLVPLLLMQAGNDLIVKKEEGKKWFEEYPSIHKIYKEFPHMFHELLQEEKRHEVLRLMLEFMLKRNEVNML